MCTTCGCGEPETNHKTITLEQDILQENQTYADANKKHLQAQNIKTYNIVASPGAGKTSLLCDTGININTPCSVIVGDQATEYDANLLKQQGINALQIFTNKVCHLDAHMVGHALEKIEVPAHSYLFIENVGNLICPALFDLGENFRVVLLSITEGEDKPLKYPYMFGSADLVVLTKMDLLPYLDFDLELCLENIRKVNKKADIIQVSTKTGEGMADWYGWLGL